MSEPIIFTAQCRLCLKELLMQGPYGFDRAVRIRWVYNFGDKKWNCSECVAFSIRIEEHE